MVTELQQLSRFCLLMTKIKSLCNKINGRTYYVRRGPINWAKFNFEKHPSAIAIVCDERTIGRENLNAATITFEMFTTLPNEEAEEIDENVMTNMSSDIENVLEEVKELKDDSKEQFVTKIHSGSDRLVEVYDTEKNIQGILVTISFDF